MYNDFSPPVCAYMTSCCLAVDVDVMLSDVLIIHRVQRGDRGYRFDVKNIRQQAFHV